MIPNPTRTSLGLPGADQALASARARALRTVQFVFAAIVLSAIACGLTIHLGADVLAIPQAIRQPAACAFLVIALADLVLLLGCSAWLSRR
jgi:hypothetical protein